jgi:alpha-galactosidase
MKKIYLLLALIPRMGMDCLAQHPEAIHLPVARFSTGNDPSWNNPAFDDRQWKEIRTGKVWQSQGYPGYHGYAWYRIHVVIPSSLRAGGHWKDSLRIFLAHVNDVDETWLNGVKIGQIGSFPEDPGGYVSQWPAVREYHVAASDALIRWDKENVIAVRDYDGGGTGGIFMGDPYLDMLERTDGLSLSLSNEQMAYLPDGRTELPVVMQNAFNTTVEGVFSWTVYDAVSEKEISRNEIPVRLIPLEKKEYRLEAPSREGVRCHYAFTEQTTGLAITGGLELPYILTPAPAASPRITSPNVFGVRPGAPFLFKIAATGQKPLSYQVARLPEGLSLDPSTGIVKGTLDKKGDYTLQIVVANTAGTARQNWTVRVGETLALTPPMGWNSWNCWGLSVSDEKVKSSAQAMIDKGLIDHGWTYMNIDDGWEEPQRDKDGHVVPNGKFPDMHALGDWLHDKGLKFGIYSSPGPLTCGGYLGSWQHEQQDAATYASWGIDYLKYDWCSYDGIVKQDTTRAAYIKPYRVMQAALRSVQRDIVYSLCQYGMKDVWKWGATVDGQSWRTTEDIEDTWESLSRIGFHQAPLYPYAGPGRWNDPDMMIVGEVGWGQSLHASRLTPDEQYTHVSLWCLLSAPLLIGCDISRLDAFTLNLLTNDEVLAVDQDILGRQARRLIKKDRYEVWVKQLEDGSKAVGIFNVDTHSNLINIDFSELGIGNGMHIRDLWRQKDLGVFQAAYSAQIPPHGVRFLKVYK